MEMKSKITPKACEKKNRVNRGAVPSGVCLLGALCPSVPLTACPSPSSRRKTNELFCDRPVLVFPAQILLCHFDVLISTPLQACDIGREAAPGDATSESRFFCHGTLGLSCE
ncbi:hypothetical protein CLAIMM_14839 [Cladophialophora immunda]|nr:hypothetical protein CLAIMM_14839 [Cladophialophora immunda]